MILKITGGSLEILRNQEDMKYKENFVASWISNHEKSVRDTHIETWFLILINRFKNSIFREMVTQIEEETKNVKRNMTYIIYYHKNQRKLV